MLVFVVFCESLADAQILQRQSPLSNKISAASASDDSPVSDRYFGMHVGFVDPGTPWPAIPFGTWRLWDANVTWKDLEPSKGVWDFSRLDSLVAQGQEHKVDMILPLALTPQWSHPASRMRRRLTRPVLQRRRSTFRIRIDYVAAVTARSKGRVAYYEMWNEMNVAGTWTGTPAQIVVSKRRLTRPSRVSIPNAKFIAANLTCSNGLPLLKQLLDLGYANSADIIGYHLYVTPVSRRPSHRCTPISLLSQHGVNKPIWNTETGWLTGSTFSSEDQAAAVAVRALLVGRSSGMERFLWYEWDNHCCVALFMTEADNATPTRAALAYANLQRWLVGNKLSPCDADETGTWSCSLQFSDGRRGVILWNPDRVITVDTRLNWTPTEVEDMYGDSAPASSAHVRVGQEPMMLCE